ncbi:MAG: hypothetical protein Q8M29_00820 [Bacteroidota bacterium]|nr:hypothetical protein [Bacteroidota bacterium]
MIKESNIIEVEVLNVIAVTLGLPAYRVSSSVDLIEGLGISLVQFNYLIWSLENNFKISFPSDASAYNTSLRLIEYVVQRQNDK